MNRAQIKAQRAQLEAEGKEIDRVLKSYTGNPVNNPTLVKRFVTYNEGVKALDAAEESLNRLERSGMGPDAASEFGGSIRVTEEGVKGLGRDVNPLVVPEVEMKGLFEAAQRRQSYQTKTFASVQDDLVPQLSPIILAPVFEQRLLNHLPTIPISTGSYQYIKHSSTSGTPALVAEGGLKPELSPVFDHVIVSAVKLAAWTSAGYESLQDFPAFSGYLQQDLIKRISAS